MKRLLWTVLVVAACGDWDHPPRVDAALSIPDVLLDVNDIGGHCSVTIGNAAPSISPEQTIGDVYPGQVPLTAMATLGFTLGLWHHTTNDTGSGDPGTIDGTGQDAVSSVTVTVTDEPACVWICCSGANDCPTTDPCR